MNYKINKLIIRWFRVQTTEHNTYKLRFSESADKFVFDGMVDGEITEEVYHCMKCGKYTTQYKQYMSIHIKEHIINGDM